MLQLFLVALFSVAVHSTDIKQKLQNPPPPVPKFNLNAFLGQWFIQFRKAPCSWPGSSTFTDYEQNLVPEGKALTNYLTWRNNGMCNRVNGRYMIAGPGVFNNVDNIGDSFSGRLQVAATDYKKFVIYWGCTRMMATGDRCDDPWISVATRFRYPPPGVVQMIESILMSRWGITLGELSRVPHKMPCQPELHKKCKF